MPRIQNLSSSPFGERQTKPLLASSLQLKKETAFSTCNDIENAFLKHKINELFPKEIGKIN